MNEFIAEYRNIIEFIGMAAAAITAVYVVYIKVFKSPVCKICHFIRTLPELPDKIGYIYAELKPNSGNSLKDTVKRIEDNQLLLMNKHRIIVDDYVTGIVETDEKGDITWANATYLEMVNRDLREILGNGWINSVHPDDRERVYRVWKEAFEQKRAFEEKFHMEKKTGERIAVHGFAYPINANEIIRGYVGKFKVVVEQK